MSEGIRLRYAFHRYAKTQCARVLTQMDRDPDSPTFGCFDRDHWHYKIRDYPSAILQQGVFTLEALRTGALTLETAASPALETWCVAAINALARQIDRSGAVDEYYPYERSYPAAAFSLYAVSRVLYDWSSSAPELLEAINWVPLKRLAHHVSSRTEDHAANQQAAGLAGLALASRTDGFGLDATCYQAHSTRLFASQSVEGWFGEYGGPDTGYLSVTLDALVDYLDVTGDPRATRSIERAVGFIAGLVGVDGRLPSTLNSRNTDYVVPYGLVRAAASSSTAAWVVRTLFGNLGDSEHAIWATDDRYHCHYIFASIVRSLAHLDRLASSREPDRQTRWLPDCGYWIHWPSDRTWTAFVAARKGGALRVHRRGKQEPTLDHGWRIRAGRGMWTTNWWSTNWCFEWRDGRVEISGFAQRAGFTVATPLRHAILRLLAVLLRERLIPLLKRAMIFRPRGATGPRFVRRIEIDDRGVRVFDRLASSADATVAPAPRQNLRHVASADSYSREELLPALNQREPSSLDRPLEAELSWEPSATR